MNSSKYSSLEELRRKKQLLKREVADMEHLLKFEDKKESLSVLTNGFTDRFIEEKPNPEDPESPKLSIKTGEIVKEIGQKITDKTEKSSILEFNNEGVKETAVKNLLKAGGITAAGAIAKRYMNKPGWKNKLIGMLLVYLIPVALKFINEKLDQFQKRKSVSSMEKLI